MPDDFDPDAATDPAAQTPERDPPPSPDDPYGLRGRTFADLPYEPGDGVFGGVMRQMAANGHPGLQAWAAQDAATRIGMQQLSAPWGIDTGGAQALTAPADPPNAPQPSDDADGGEGDDDSDGQESEQHPPSRDRDASPSIGLTQHGGAPASGDDPSPIDEVVVTASRIPGATYGGPGAAQKAQPSANFQLSGQGVDFMKRYEKGRNGDFAATPYPSPEGGAPTVGWGHKIQPNEVFNKALTGPQADALFLKDTAAAERRVKQATRGQSLTQNQYDALVSFAYNLPSAFQARPDNLFLSRLQSGDLAGAADRMPLWNRAGPDKKPMPGLTTRRQDERNLFLNGVYPSAN